MSSITEPAAVVVEAPIPMSFPAVLRNPLLADRYAHLRPSKPASAPLSGTGKPLRAKGRRDDNEGKRWVRRKENAKFSGNPHIVPASKRDMLLPTPHALRTFPEPLPAFLARSAPLPPAAAPALDPASASAGRFSLSLKGMRRELRRLRGAAQGTVRAVEGALTAWLAAPSAADADEGVRFPGAPVAGRGDLREVARGALRLVWATDDALVRYVVHCCARFHGVVSFSKELGGRRCTFLLRPSTAQLDRARGALDTPPATDFSDHASLHESDRASDLVSEPPSDIESDLSAIDESDAQSHAGDTSLDHDEWSVIDADSDAEGDESASEHGSAALARSVESLSLQGAVVREHHLAGLRSPAVWSHRQGRSASSPSRSPSRRPARRVHARIDPPRVDAGTGGGGKGSFYDYLYN
ncbi:hypothetical protein HWV62_5540 [Athelia sp. TMB]|nr:hypothetical protein HWV62_5540 [Athelia sp. TMB]